MIKNIIFDLGGVLYDIDFSLSTNAFATLGISFTSDDWTCGSQAALLDCYEKGGVSTDDFLSALIACGRDGIGSDDVYRACCALLVGFSAERIEYLTSLKKNYRLFLLSNTNEMHLAVVEQQLRDEFSLLGLRELFVEPYVSCRMGLRKPDARIYQRVLAEQGLVPEETLFVDDLKENTDAAAACGLQVFHKPAQMELTTHLPERLRL